MPDPFTIRIFVPDGDPDGVRRIDRMNWTGLGLAFPRAKWPEIKKQKEFTLPGIYVLVGYSDEEDDLPTIYVGQADGVRTRMESHYKRKDFWEWAIVFVSTSGGLNRAHVTWLEAALINRAIEADRCQLDNTNIPKEPALTEAEKADTQGFLKEILQILPLVNLRVFDKPKAVATPTADIAATSPNVAQREFDTVIVPARKEGFERVFLGEDCWHAIRIAPGKLDKINYIAAYQVHPISAITHYAPVERIEPYGETGKYKLIFSEKAQSIGPINLGDAPPTSMQGIRYAKLARLNTAKQLSDIF